MNLIRNWSFVALLALCAFALAAEELTVEALIKDATKLDGKDVAVVGKVEGFRQRTSKIGNAYFTFKLKGKEDSINVYSRGKMDPAIKDGDKVEVKGVYRKEKKLQDFVVKNEIDATPAEGEDKEKKKFGVKVLERAKG